MSESNTEFGTVNRLRGIVFEYTTLTASLVGIVALAVLLGYVAVDAFGFGAADPAWFGIWGVLVGLPVLGSLALAIRRPAVGQVLLGTTVRLLGGAALSAAVAVLFVIYDIQLWVLIYTTGVLPAALVGWYAYRRSRLEVAAAATLAVLAAGTAFAIYLKGPLATFPIDPLIHLWTLGVPVAVGVAVWANQRLPRERAGTFGASVLVGAALAAGVAALARVDPAAGVLLVLTSGVALGAYAAELRREDVAGRIGFLLPFVVVAGVVIARLVVDLSGVTPPASWLDWQFLTSAPSRFPERAGIFPAIVGSVFIICLVAVFTFFLGVGTAVYLEEYAPSRGWEGTLTRVIRVNISNLAGVPSVVYGLLGLAAFVNFLGLDFGIVIVAALTLTLLILPIVVISAQEAIRAVPDDARQASYGMGATRWQTVREVVIPQAMPGILTGTILALGRAIGETAPLIIVGLATTKFTPPDGLLDTTAAMPTQVFHWAFLPDDAFRHGVVAAGVVTLVAVLLTMNSIAIYVRNSYQRR